MTKELKSPVSDAIMVEEKIRGVTVHKDPETGGYWLRQSELQALSEIEASRLQTVYAGQTMQVHQGRVCPEDGTGLMEFEFADHSGVKVDLCTQCRGIWLDSGELNNLITYLKDHDFGKHLDTDEEVGITDRVLLFLYELTAHPPLY